MKKKILSGIYILFVAMLLTVSSPVKAADSYRFNIVNQDIRIVGGMEHRRVNGDLTFNGKESKQYYNYLNLNNSKTGYHLVGIDNYSKNGWGMHSLATFIEVYERDNPHMEVVAGVNGSFYYINETGQPTTAHIRDYEVVGPPLSNPSIALATNSRGESEFVNVVQEGNEVLVYNSNNEVKYRKKVAKLNAQTTSDKELTVLFNNYIGDVPKDLNPVYIKGLDIKSMTQRSATHANFYVYGKGIQTDVHEGNKVPEQQFVIIDEELSNILVEGDTVLFQPKLRGFEDVGTAVSTTLGRGPLVVNGVIDPIMEMEQHPRTAIGIKENGDIFFMVVDGRDRITPKHGVSLPEFAHLMYSYGAVQAYNFDGGGSSTLMLRNNVAEGTVLERFDVLNELSDGRLRSLSNGFLVVKGDVAPRPVDIRGIEKRSAFETPGNVYVDNEMKLHFDLVKDATYYEVFINGLKIETKSNEVQLRNLRLGDNEIVVRTRGTQEFSASDNSVAISYRIYSDAVSSLLNLLKNNK